MVHHVVVVVEVDVVVLLVDWNEQGEGHHMLHVLLACGAIVGVVLHEVLHSLGAIVGVVLHLILHACVVVVVVPHHGLRLH